MRKIRFAAFAVAAALPAAAQTNADVQGLSRAAASFYNVYMTLHPSDGIPDAGTRARFAPYVSSALDKLFADGNAAEIRYADATHHQSPPLVEGDPFTPNFEGATSYRIGACKIDAAGGRCQVALTYDDRKDPPIAWTDTVELVRSAAGWRVDDIAYGGKFGGTGSLTQTLRDAIANGNEFSH